MTGGPCSLSTRALRTASFSSAPKAGEAKTCLRDDDCEKVCPSPVRPVRADSTLLASKSSKRAFAYRRATEDLITGSLPNHAKLRDEQGKNSCGGARKTRHSSIRKEHVSSCEKVGNATE